MKKQTIAVDIDDVLADNAGGFIAFSTQRWGTHLSPEDYDERFAAMWEIDEHEAERRAVEFHGSGVIGRYRHDPGASPVLRELSKNYRLIVITSRRKQVAQESLAWLDRYYAGIFSDVHFAGMWDKADPLAHQATKAELSRELGADYLIDDQPKHCIGAAEAGLTALLFGDYKWNRHADVPTGVVRVKDWLAVEEYFHAQG
jgi:5'(3')-deoxyribonucleotidase